MTKDEADRKIAKIMRELELVYPNYFLYRPGFEDMRRMIFEEIMKPHAAYDRAVRSALDIYAIHLTGDKEIIHASDRLRALDNITRIAQDIEHIIGETHYYPLFMGFQRDAINSNEQPMHINQRAIDAAKKIREKAKDEDFPNHYCLTADYGANDETSNP